MSLQMVAVWAALILGVLASFLGMVVGDFFTHPAWTSAGAIKLTLFTAAYGLWTLAAAKSRPRFFFPILAIAAALYAVIAVGPLAVAGALFLLLGSFSLGLCIFRSRVKFINKYPQAVLFFGFAIIATGISLTASWPLHRWWTYSIALLIPIFQAYRQGLFQGIAFAPPENPQETAWPALAMFPAFANFASSLKPEVSADGLSMHLVLAARMSARHSWSFDGAEFAWAVMPMNGDWLWSAAYQLGGEGAAKLLNASILVLVCWLLFAWLHEFVPGKLAALLTAGFASTPMVLRVTGSLDVENVAASFILAAMLYYRRYMKAKKQSDAMACLFLAGAAAATTMSAAGLLLPFAFVVLLSFRARHAILAGLLGVSAGAIPYLAALWRTGNPVFPYVNRYFRSPLFDMTMPFVDGRAASSIDWLSWFDFSFHSSRFGATGNGAFGIMFFILVPVAILAFRASWPATILAGITISVAGGYVVMLISPNIQNLYPALPVLTLAIGAAAATLRTRGTRIETCLVAWCCLSVLVHMAIQPVAAPEHAGFLMPQLFNHAEVESFLAKYAPERPLVETLNAKAPAARVAWMESNAIANFTGRSFSNTWHSYAFWRSLKTSTAAEGHLYEIGRYQIEYFIAPASDSLRPISNVLTREFLDIYTEPVSRFADLELRKLSPNRRGLAGLPQPYAQPGRYDELNSFVRYEGAWGRSLEFPSAYRGTLSYSNDARSRVHIRFQGQAITLLHTAALNRCRALASVDGAEDIPLSEFSETTVWQSKLPRIAVPPGYHRLTVRFPQPELGTSTILGCFLDLDGFIVE